MCDKVALSCFLFVCLFCQTAGLRSPQLLASLVVSGWHHTWEGDLRAFTAYARIMLNGLITKPKLGIHYTAQTSQSREEAGSWIGVQLELNKIFTFKKHGLLRRFFSLNQHICLFQIYYLICVYFILLFFMFRRGLHAIFTTAVSLCDHQMESSSLPYSIMVDDHLQPEVLRA